MAGLVVLFIATFNRFVALRQRANEAWSDIDVQLKRRADLVPGLVEIVGGYAGHEHATFADVARWRGAAAEARTPEARATAESGLSQALRGLLAVIEAYPELKADEGFRALQEQLAAIEADAQSSRRYYNAVVRDLNTLIEKFPSSLVASLGGFRQRAFFEIDQPADRQPPRVSFQR
jgi:LemA protein